MRIWTTVEVIFALILAFSVGAVAVYYVYQDKLQTINTQVSKSVKQQQISNTNDMCFQYINTKIQKDLHNK